MTFLKNLMTRKFGLLALVLCLIIGAAGLYTAQLTIHATNSIEFCTSCHTMSTPLHEYQKTAHFKNRSGVRAVCSDCHVPHEGFALIKAKVIAANDLIAEMRGLIDTPEKFEARRLELAQRVWDKMEASGSRECKSCHDLGSMELDKQGADARTQHEKAETSGQSCISCHRGVAHNKPDMSALSKNALKAMEEKMGSDWKVGSSYYPIDLLPLMAEPADDAAGAGTVLPATAMTVVENKGDWAKVEIKGWRQEEVDGIIYAVRGQRIFSVTVKEDGQPLITKGASWTDQDTGYNWTETTLTAWIKRQPMTDDVSGLWSYAQGSYNASCSSCHTAYTADHFTANQWPSIIKSMERFAQMPRAQNFLVVKYLQLHTTDVVNAKSPH